MEQEWQKKIRGNFVFLTDSLDLSAVPGYLYQEGLLDVDQLERFTNKSDTTTHDQARRLLLEILRTASSEKCPDPYQTFINGLNESGFKHVPVRLQETIVPVHHDTHTTSGTLTFKHFYLSEESKNKLQACHQFLIDWLKPDVVVDHLFQEFVLDSDNMEAISMQLTVRDKCKKLFKILSCKKQFYCLEDPFRVFVNTLEITDQKCIVYELEKSTLSITKGKINV